MPPTSVLRRPPARRLAFATTAEVATDVVRRVRTLDLVCSALVVVAACVMVLTWHLRSASTVVPFHDGSHHVANVANVVAGVRAEGLGSFLSFADRSAPDAFTYGVFALASFAVGVGRFAFGVVWVVCLASVAIALALHFRRAPGMALLVTLALLLYGGLFQTEQGGARDTRVDLLAVTFGVISLLLLINRRVFAACLCLLAACFAKGASVSLLVPLLLLGVVLGFVPLGGLRRPTVGLGARCAIVAALSWQFVTRIGPQAVSYNLMATGGATPQDRVTIFVANSWRYLARDPWYYVGDLAARYQGWLLLSTLVFVALALVRRWPFSHWRLGAYAALALAYTDLLMTVSPLHSPVLTIWFLPAVVLALAFSAGAFARVVPAIGGLAAAVALLVPTVPNLSAAPLAPGGPYLAPTNGLFGQASAIAALLDQQYGGRSARAVVLTNFLTVDPPVSYNYDVYRVLVQEHLRSASVVLDGWELGSFGKNWRPELDAQNSYAEIFFVVQQHPAGIEAGESVRDFVYAFQRTHPDCLTPVGQAFEAAGPGRQDALRLTTTDVCRQALFDTPA